MRELKYVLENVQAPLTSLLQSITAAIAAAVEQAQQLATLFDCLRLICRIFFSLNWQDLPEFFEVKCSVFQPQFAKPARVLCPKILSLLQCVSASTGRICLTSLR